jgi:myo-inositol-1(or 4)-monophosphatase
VNSIDFGIDALMHFSQELMQRTGAEAMKYYGKGKHGIKFDQELITTAELALRRMFIEEIRDRFPEHQVFDNTNSQRDYTHDETRYLWIYDPIDGVANFLAGIPIWGMSLALLDNYWPVLGVFHMPATGDIFHAKAGEIAYWGKQRISISPQQTINDESLLLIYSRFHRHYHSNFPGKIRNLGCTAAHICYVAMGRAEAAFVANESYQDLAAAQIIIQAAGGNIFKTDGRVLTVNEYIDGHQPDEHLLAAAPRTHRLVLRCLQKSDLI